MCFRPATASGGDVQKNRCPECGKINKPIATVCVQCGHELTPPEQAGPPDLKMHLKDRPAKPGAPAAPKAPGAPSSPQVPSAASAKRPDSED